MLQEMIEQNSLDGEGRPAGGTAEAVGLLIKWQDGPVGYPPDQSKINGTWVETVLTACLHRLEFYNDSPFRCRENSLAITKIEEALHWLDARVKDRVTRGVQGEHKV